MRNEDLILTDSTPNYIPSSSKDDEQKSSNLDSSGLTEFDLLTRTQISVNMHRGRSGGEKDLIDPSLRSHIILPPDDMSSLSKSQITNNDAGALSRRTVPTPNNYQANQF